MFLLQLALPLRSPLALMVLSTSPTARLEYTLPHSLFFIDSPGVFICRTQYLFGAVSKIIDLLQIDSSENNDRHCTLAKSTEEHYLNHTKRSKDIALCYTSYRALSYLNTLHIHDQCICPFSRTTHVKRKNDTSIIRHGPALSSRCLLRTFPDLFLEDARWSKRPVQRVHLR